MLARDILAPYSHFMRP